MPTSKRDDNMIISQVINNFLFKHSCYSSATAPHCVRTALSLPEGSNAVRGKLSLVWLLLASPWAWTVNAHTQHDRSEACVVPICWALTGHSHSCNLREAIIVTSEQLRMLKLMGTVHTLNQTTASASHTASSPCLSTAQLASLEPFPYARGNQWDLHSVIFTLVDVPCSVLWPDVRMFDVCLLHSPLCCSHLSAGAGWVALFPSAARAVCSKGPAEHFCLPKPLLCMELGQCPWQLPTWPFHWTPRARSENVV